MDGTALQFTGILHDLKLFEIVIDVVGMRASEGSPRQSPRSRERNADPVLTLGGSLDAAPLAGGSKSWMAWRHACSLSPQFPDRWVLAALAPRCGCCVFGVVVWGFEG